MGAKGVRRVGFARKIRGKSGKGVNGPDQLLRSWGRGGKKRNTQGRFNNMLAKKKKRSRRLLRRVPCKKAQRFVNATGGTGRED